MSRRWVAVSVLLFGCTDEGGAGNSPALRCEAGTRCAATPDAGMDAPLDSGTLTCPVERAAPVMLAERLGYPSEVIAPATTADPALVTESASEGTRVTVVDVAACESVWSGVLPGAPRALVAAGRQLIWMEAGTVRVRAVDHDVERVVTLQHPALDLHLDATWLYVLTAERSPAAVMPTSIERVARARLTEPQIQSEPWIRVQFDPVAAAFNGRLTGSAERLIAGFWSIELDETSGPGPTIRIDSETGAQAVLAPGESSYGMFPLGSQTYLQRGSELLVYEDTQEPVALRTDLEELELVGVIPGHAVARAPSAQLLLALPFDGGERVQIADEQAPFAGVATAGEDVYWVNWAHRLMTVRGVPQ